MLLCCWPSGPGLAEHTSVHPPPHWSGFTPVCTSFTCHVSLLLLLLPVPVLQPLTELAGTLEYMAPEVLQRNYGAAADVWSTGVMLHELISGLLPFTGNSTEQVG